MNKEAELQYAIYIILKTQIEFGTYRYMERLPNTEEACDLLLVSIDTIRSAYRRLQKEKYITLSKNKGSVVSVNYSDQELEQHIQIYFAERKVMLTELCHSMYLLLSDLQVIAWKNTPHESINRMKGLTSQWKAVYIIVHYVQVIYGALGNDILIRLAQQMHLFLLLPFFSLPDYQKYINLQEERFLDKNNIYHELHWQELSAGLESFYSSRITLPSPEHQVSFTWSSYQRASQRCYSLGLEIIREITRGVYLDGGYLPSLEILAQKKNVSVSTVRRTLALLNSIGVTKSINGVGTLVLPVEQIEENCDFTNPAVRKRLLDSAHSCQILAFSCQKVTEFTVSSIDARISREWINQLNLFKDMKRADLAPTLSIEFIFYSAPYHVLKVVYEELFDQLFWGYSLLSNLSLQKKLHEHSLPYLNGMIDALENLDSSGFASLLSELMRSQHTSLAESLLKHGVSEAAGILNCLI